ncbi:hypothetical protein [Luteibacter sp.]|uniref:hypothetical protein n=1 Tax=Luteibacter sp. TaxID=1886636 RepID=UPI002F3FFD3A
MLHIDSSAPLPLATIIAATVALDDALGRTQYPQARHHARMLVLRSETGEFADIATAARELMTALDQTSRPERTHWGPALDRVHHAVDQALDDVDDRS